MTTIKKTNKNSIKSPAPATKPAKPAPKKQTAKAVPVRASAGARKRSALVPKVKAAAAKPVETTITAIIDVDFGNTLHVRGEGPGLSWDQGLLMTCVADDRWQITLGKSARPFILKFLVNDLTWSVGPDFTISAGGSVTVTPEF